MESIIPSNEGYGPAAEAFGYDPYLLAAYPLVVILTFSSFLLCTYAIWKTRHDIIPLWYVGFGLIFTKLGLCVENLLILRHELDGFQAIPLVPMLIIKFFYMVGTTFQAWGIILVVARTTARDSRFVLGLFAILVCVVYYILVLVFRTI